MATIVLDSNIIIRHPQILALFIPNTRLVVPFEVIDELTGRAMKNGGIFEERIDLIAKAADSKTITIFDTTEQMLTNTRKSTSANGIGIGAADLALIATSIELSKQEKDVKIATQDKKVWQVANEWNIEILNSNDIGSLINLNKHNSTPTSKEVQQKLIQYERREKLTLYKGILIGFVITGTTIILYFNFQVLLATMNMWGTVVVSIISGVALFLFREKQRLSYGIFEFLVGVTGVFAIFMPYKFDFSIVNFGFDLFVKLLGALYIMVRGQDNIVKAIKDTKAGIWLKNNLHAG